MSMGLCLLLLHNHKRVYIVWKCSKKVNWGHIEDFPEIKMHTRFCRVREQTHTNANTFSVIFSMNAFNFPIMIECRLNMPEFADVVAPYVCDVMCFSLQTHTHTPMHFSRAHMLIIRTSACMFHLYNSNPDFEENIICVAVQCITVLMICTITIHAFRSFDQNPQF